MPTSVRNLAIKLARIAGKIVLFIVLFSIFALLIDSSKFISVDTTSAFSAWLYGESSQENFDDLWFFVDAGSSLIFAIVAYCVIMRVIRKLRR